MDAQFTELLGRMMMVSGPGLAEIVLKGIATVEDAIKKEDPVVAAKDKEIAELDKEFNETLSKLVNIEHESTADDDFGCAYFIVINHFRTE